MNTTIQKTLISMGEEEYRKFSSSLMPTVEKSKVIGKWRMSHGLV